MLYSASTQTDVIIYPIPPSAQNSCLTAHLCINISVRLSVPWGILFRNWKNTHIPAYSVPSPTHAVSLSFQAAEDPPPAVEVEAAVDDQMEVKMPQEATGA